MSVLIWVQCLCKGYQQTTKVTASREGVNMYLTALSRLGNKNYETKFEKDAVTFALVKVALKPVTS